jgi:hypothetical protein
VSGAAVEAEAGLQAAAGTNESSSAAFRAAGKIRVPLSQDYSLGATLFTGLEPVTFGEYLERNPYFSTRSGIAYSHALIAVGGMIHYHPAPSFSGIAGVRFVLRDNAQYFHYDTLGMFAVSPGNTSQAEAQAEFAWKPDVGNVLSSNITVVSAKFSDTSGTVPYLPALRVAAEWSAIWSRRIGTRITATWVGSQYVQRGIQRELDGFFTLGIRGDYTLQHDISFFVRLDNITNSTVMIWDGYSERGIYASAGVLWKF